jgi:hypothetical protein
LVTLLTAMELWGASLGQMESPVPDKPQIQHIIPESVDPAYRHVDKISVPKQCLTVSGRWLKWYDISLPTLGVPGEIHAMARSFLARRAEEGALDHLGVSGFVILHRCGEHFYFLIVCSWRGSNEIWETVFAKDRIDGDFRDFSRSEPHLPTFCVWELGAVCHERRAWVRFLRSTRDETAFETWLADQYEGAV